MVKPPLNMAKLFTRTRKAMAVFNAAKREIDIKIVYYGPALCGKTTNVQCIHRLLAPEQRGELMSLATKDDRTLFFDFLPIELGEIKGFKTRFHVYTVPGQVYYALTRRAVLTGVDGVVFVADSQTSKLQENIESLNDLRDNLKYYKKDLASQPFIMQYNKRDLDDILSIEELNAALNILQVPFFAASAIQGTGVVETLTAICKAVLKQMDRGKEKKARPSVQPPEQQSGAQPETPLFESAEEEPIVTIFRGSASPATPELVQPRMDEGYGTDEDTSATSPLRTTLQFKDESSKPISAPEISLDACDDAEEKPQPFSSFEKTLHHFDMERPGISLEQPHKVKIVSCGQPYKISDSMVKVPIILSLGSDDQSCTIHVTISID